MAEKLMSDGCNRVFAKRFTILSLYDLSILIDDSLSMVTEEEGIQIKTLGKILRRVSPVYALAREDGIYTMDFLNEPDGYADFTAEDINEILMNHSYYGWTRIGTELKSKVLSENVHDNMKKPLLVLTITGGDIEGERDGVIEPVIERYVKNLQKQYGSTQGSQAVEFHFTRVGNDIGAINLLESLEKNDAIGNYAKLLPCE
ncbi:hypothetical protein FPQ18DRAFT_265952 [Pyronema domesticum]|nr:hypothetical protein FPQ18DRAFT_265952 [Pyronema domesticum]